MAKFFTDDGTEVHDILDIEPLAESEITDILRGLLVWNTHMGGFDAPCWRQAADMYAELTGDRIFAESYDDPVEDDDDSLIGLDTSAEDEEG